MKAVKGNKVYTIDESQKKAYQDAGFDIMDNGKVIAYGRGKTVPYGDYVALMEENDRLHEKIKELEGGQQEKKPSRKAGE